MEARKLATQMAAICPFVLVLGMGYSARQSVTGHLILQYSAAQNDRIVAYGPLVADAPPKWSNMPQVRRQADLWIRLASRNRLQALTPAFQEDLSEDNVRAEIVAQWRWLQTRINHEMRLNAAAGDYESAVADGTRMIRLSQILKYSDFETLHCASTVSTRTISLIGPNLMKVSTVERLNFDEAASSINQNRRKFVAMYQVIKKNYEEFLRRRVGAESGSNVDPTGLTDDDGSAQVMNSENLQRAYVSAINDEAIVRATARTYLGLKFSSAKS